jgi:hypothetical protein
LACALRDEAYALRVRQRQKAAKDAGSAWAHREEIAARIRRDIDDAFAPEARPRTRQLPWRLLPPGELFVEGLRRHYDGLQRRNPEIRYGPERLETALSLGPEERYVGAGEFDGYVVFTYPGTERVLLECPVYGNAVYVLGSDWKRLSKQSKAQSNPKDVVPNTAVKKMLDTGGPPYLAVGAPALLGTALFVGWGTFRW